MRRISKERKRKAAVLRLLTICLCLAAPLHAFAASVPFTGMEGIEDSEGTGPSLDQGDSREGRTVVNGLSDYSAEEKERLADSRLEYGEISGRIELYNADYKKLRTQLNQSFLSLDAAKALAAEADERMEDARDLKSDDMDPETRILFEGYKESAQELRKQAERLTNGELPGSYERLLRQTKNQLTKAVQNLFLQYETVEAQTAVAAKNREFAEAQLEAVKAMASLGQKALPDVQAAEENLRKAENTEAQAESGLMTIRQNLKILLGWDYNEEIEIIPAPEPDASRIASMNPETDTQAAVWANYDLQSIKQAAASGTANRTVKRRNISVTEGSVTAKLGELYAGVLAKQQAYEAARAALEAGERDWREAEKKNSLGMMGRLEYLGAELSWLNAQAGWRSASVEFLKAMEDYDWAVKGLISTN